MKATPRLVLASGSPRRRQLLRSLGLRFEVRPVDVDETPLNGEPVDELIERLALAKARAMVGRGELILAADTVVVLAGDILGKPADPADARRMLSRLQGREHTVVTGVAMFDGEKGQRGFELDRTRVRLGAMDARRIRWYVATGEPMDKAGSYAIQGLGAAFVESIQGNYTNVVGLPLPTVRALMDELGYDLFAFGG